MKNIVITGTTSGIGKELVKIFASDSDVKIFAGYRNVELLDDFGSNVEYFYIDMKNRQSIIDATQNIKSKVDKIDIVINVAGAVVAGPIEILDTDRLREQFEELST
jgi:NADP-dependent 3-hydroxy acid dehydrogenase YdfG